MIKKTRSNKLTINSTLSQLRLDTLVNSIMRSSVKNNKILYAIIAFVTVDMMNMLRLGELSSKLFFHFVSMLTNIFLRTKSYVDVAAFSFDSYLPSSVRVCLRPSVFCSTTARASKARMFSQILIATYSTYLKRVRLPFNSKAFLVPFATFFFPLSVGSFHINKYTNIGGICQQ